MRSYSYGWYSHRANKHMEFLHFGHAGAPVVVFPTSGGNQTEFPQQGMLDPIAWKIEHGFIQVFCVDTNNWEGWYNDHIHPRQKVEMHAGYEEYLIHEFLPHVRNVTGTGYLILMGISFGAFHTMNFALKHPEMVDRAICMSGSYSIKGFLDGYYDDLCYFNNPVDYIQNLHDPWYINMYNTHTEITMVTSDLDVCLNRNIEMSDHLNAKGIRHNFYKWDGGYKHDWPYWKIMIPHYL